MSKIGMYKLHFISLIRKKPFSGLIKANIPYSTDAINKKVNLLEISKRDAEKITYKQHFSTEFARVKLSQEGICDCLRRTYTVNYILFSLQIFDLIRNRKSTFELTKIH